MRITKQHLKKIIREEVLFSEGLRYHLREGVSLSESVYRPGSKAFFDLINEARARCLARASFIRSKNALDPGLYTDSDKETPSLK